MSDEQSITVVNTGSFSNGLLPITFEIKLNKVVTFEIQMTGYSDNQDYNEAIQFAKQSLFQDLATFADLGVTGQL